MTIKEIPSVYDSAVEVIQNIRQVRDEMHGKQFTQKLFDELNGEERGIEKILGKAVYDIDLMDAMEQLNLRNEIFAKLEASETEAIGAIRAALECYSDNLVGVVQKYDAHFDGNAKIRGSLREKVASMNDEGKQAFLEAKVDCLAFSYTNSLAAIESVNVLNEFLNSDACNLERLIDLSTRQGGDMTDEDREFIENIRKTIEADVEEKQRNMWRAKEDRLIGVKVSVLGYDADKLVEVANALTKAENDFIKAVRTLREALVHDDQTDESIVIKNSDYTSILGRIGWRCSDSHETCELLGEQIAAMAKLLDLDTSASAGAKSEEEETQKKDDTSSGETGGAEPEA